MTLIRRLLAPLVAGLIAILALVAPGAVGAQGTLPAAASAPAAASPPTAAASATGPTGATGPTVSPGTLSVTVSACHADPLQAKRYAIFTAQMTSLPATRTMAVNLELQERGASAAAFTAVSAPGFGVWVASQPGVGIYIAHQEVTALPAPAAFRVVVRARWLDRRRRVMRREQLLSPVCAQPLETPNLAIGTLRRALGAQTGSVVYSLQVLNAGAAAAGAFQVSLTVNGVALADESVASLAAGATAVVQFSGPPCTAGSTLTAVADPGVAVVEPANPARTKAFPCRR